MVRLDQEGGRRILDERGSLLAEAVDPEKAIRLVALINMAVLAAEPRQARQPLPFDAATESRYEPR